MNANSISGAGRFAGKAAFSTGPGTGIGAPFAREGADVVVADVANAEKPCHRTGRMVERRDIPAGRYDVWHGPVGLRFRTLCSMIEEPKAFA